LLRHLAGAVQVVMGLFEGGHLRFGHHQIAQLGMGGSLERYARAP
jgi:hypothetical protein